MYRDAAAQQTLLRLYGFEGGSGLEDIRLSKPSFGSDMPAHGQQFDNNVIAEVFWLTSGLHSPTTSIAWTCNSLACPAPMLSVSTPDKRTAAPFVRLKAVAISEWQHWTLSILGTHLLANPGSGKTACSPSGDEPSVMTANATLFWRLTDLTQPLT